MVFIEEAEATEFPEITMTLEGEEETTYEGIEYKMTYKDNVMTIKTTERFYKLYPEEYEEYVDYCEDFQIENVVEEEVWNAMNEDADQGWYFIEGAEAKTSIEFTEEQIIKID